MKTGIEMVIYVFICFVGFYSVFSVYKTGLEIADAKQYHTWMIEKLEGAKFAHAVQEECVNEAKKQGYQLLVEEETEHAEKRKKITLKYRISLLFGESEEEYEVIGYSYWKGGDKI
jgi:hypothetical protein